MMRHYKAWLAKKQVKGKVLQAMVCVPRALNFSPTLTNCHSALDAESSIFRNLLDSGFHRNDIFGRNSKLSYLRVKIGNDPYLVMATSQTSLIRVLISEYPTGMTSVLTAAIYPDRFNTSGQGDEGNVRGGSMAISSCAGCQRY
jgi:hypothetical protein